MVEITTPFLLPTGIIDRVPYYQQYLYWAESDLFVQVYANKLCL
ncbi:hypothetical protein EMIT07CA2_40017 [Brevibacillus sp. IT-7CA2]